MAMRKLWKKGLIGALAISMLAACSDSSSGSNEVNSDLTLEEITKKKQRKKETLIQSVCQIHGQTGWRLGKSLVRNIA